MPVNNYLKDCKYSLNNLDNYIYLYTFDEPILNFITDDGENNATATSIKGSSQRLYCNSVQYQSTTSIDNRFAFDNTLTVTLSEHSKVSHYSIIQTLLNGNWMVVFKNTYGDAFVVNAEYPVMVSYSYVINDEKTPNNLTITFRALQNVPTVNLKGSVAFSSTLCDNYCEYNISRIESLKMIDMNKATIDVDNDGFTLTENGVGNLKTIEFNPTSMSFTDSFDGREFSQTLTFQIPFESYRYYFHYNLLEFLDNRYYALIKTTDDNNILGGFRQGLFPSYTISTADNNNVITITLNAKYTNYSVLGSDTMSTTTNDSMFYKPVIGECVDKLYVWTLIEQYNANGVATNGYYCLSGFEDIYNDYTILGTYDKYDTRFGFKLIDYNIDCSEGCKINNLPSSIQFENSGETKCYTLDTTCSIVWEWNSTAIDFTYDEITKEMCVTSKVDEGTFNIKATTTDGTIQYATVVIGNGGITGDTTTTLNITAEGQRVTVIPVKGMSNVKSLTSSLQYQVNQNGNGYEVTVPENTREETKTYTITILYKDNSIETVSIIQERIYYIITSSEETECYGQNLYYVDKKYKKYTENGELIFVENIKGNQKETDSVICLDFDEKVSGCTNCFEGFVYTLYEYKKDGTTIATRYEKTTSSCTNNATTEYVVNTEKAKCVDGTEYYVEEMYGANCNGGNNVKLYPVIERTSIVEATDSNVCDVIDPNASGGTLYRWVDTNETYCLTNTAQTNCTSSTTSTYCDGYNLFEQTTYYVDALCNGSWVINGSPTNRLLEENSTICGYVNPDEPDEPIVGTNCTYSIENYNLVQDETLTFSNVFNKGTYFFQNEMVNINQNEFYEIDKPLTYQLTSYYYNISNNGGYYYYIGTSSSFNPSYNNIIYRDDYEKTLFTYINNEKTILLDFSGYDVLEEISDKNNFYFVIENDNETIGKKIDSNYNVTNTTLIDYGSKKIPSELIYELGGVRYFIDYIKYALYPNAIGDKYIPVEESESGTIKSYLIKDNSTVISGDVLMYCDDYYIIRNNDRDKKLTIGRISTNTEVDLDDIYNNSKYFTFTITNENKLYVNLMNEPNTFKKSYSYDGLTLETITKANSFGSYLYNNELDCYVGGAIGFNISENRYKYYYLYGSSDYGNEYLGLLEYLNLENKNIGLGYIDIKNKIVLFDGYNICFDDFKKWINYVRGPISGDTSGSTNGTLSFEFSGSTTTYILNNKTYTATSSPYSTTLDDLDIETLKCCDNTFCYNSSITKVTSFPDTSNVTDMDSMFWNCKNITSINLENFNTSNVTTMGAMFSTCGKLTSLDLSSFDTSNVTYMNYMFRDCTNLQTLNVTGWNVSNVTNMRDMFRNCTSLNSLILGEVTQTTYDWWCARLTESGLSCDIIDCTIISNAGGGIVDAE